MNQDWKKKRHAPFLRASAPRVRRVHHHAQGRKAVAPEVLPGWNRSHDKKKWLRHQNIEVFQHKLSEKSPVYCFKTISYNHLAVSQNGGVQHVWKASFEGVGPHSHGTGPRSSNSAPAPPPKQRPPRSRSAGRGLPQAPSRFRIKTKRPGTDQHFDASWRRPLRGCLLLRNPNETIELFWMATQGHFSQPTRPLMSHDQNLVGKNCVHYLLLKVSRVLFCSHFRISQRQFSICNPHYLPLLLELANYPGLGFGSFEANQKLEFARLPPKTI